ncbi:MAG: hypothetical protein WA324_08000 [Bryobacteraceae bacterium]
MSSEELQQLFARTLSGDYDDDQPWNAVRELRLGTRDVLEIAAEWCHSADPLIRARGADVIADQSRRSWRTFRRGSGRFPRQRGQGRTRRESHVTSGSRAEMFNLC